MKIKLLTILSLLLCVVCLQAQQAPHRLTFNGNGEFKIAQFTDMHLGTNQVNNQVVFDMIRQVVDTEKPDLVVFTGDNTICDDVQQLWNKLSAGLASAKIPFTAVLGNHDDEHIVSRKDIMDIIRKQPYCIINSCDDVAANGDHVIPVYGSQNGNKPGALLYCMDSNAYSTIDTIKGYGWFNFGQVQWYRNKSREYTRNNAGNPYPALAFFHIPLPEYSRVWNSFETRRFGDRNENECAPKVNSGMFLAMLEAGDVMGTFVGHDHVNDYIGTLYNIALTYGRASGGKNSYGYKVPGSRIIVLKENKRAFDTWIREKDNTGKIDSCNYPESFKVSK